MLNLTLRFKFSFCHLLTLKIRQVSWLSVLISFLFPLIFGPHDYRGLPAWGRYVSPAGVHMMGGSHVLSCSIHQGLHTVSCRTWKHAYKYLLAGTQKCGCGARQRLYFLSLTLTLLLELLSALTCKAYTCPLSSLGPSLFGVLTHTWFSVCVGFQTSDLPAPHPAHGTLRLDMWPYAW